MPSINNSYKIMKYNDQNQSTTLPETNRLKMDGWKTTFLLGMAYFQWRTVSFRERKREKHTSAIRVSIHSHQHRADSRVHMGVSKSRGTRNDAF